MKARQANCNVFVQQVLILRKCQAADHTHSFRTSDALHIPCAREHLVLSKYISRFASADRSVAALAEKAPIKKQKQTLYEFSTGTHRQYLPAVITKCLGD